MPRLGYGRTSYRAPSQKRTSHQVLCSSSAQRALSISTLLLRGSSLSFQSLLFFPHVPTTINPLSMHTYLHTCFFFSSWCFVHEGWDTFRPVPANVSCVWRKVRAMHRMHTSYQFYQYSICILQLIYGYCKLIMDFVCGYAEKNLKNV